jgi:hypothetical protein
MSFEDMRDVITRLASVFEIYINAESIVWDEPHDLRKLFQ